MDGPEQNPVLDYGLRFQPVRYIKETFVPATNRHLQKIGIQQPITFKEYLLVQALLYGMKVYKLPEKDSTGPQSKKESFHQWIMENI